MAAPSGAVSCRYRTTTITAKTIAIDTTQTTPSNAFAETAATLFQYPTILTVPDLSGRGLVEEIGVEVFAGPNRPELTHIVVLWKNG